MKEKICKDCGEKDIEKLFSFQRKKDIKKTICNICNAGAFDNNTNNWSK